MINTSLNRTAILTLPIAFQKQATDYWLPAFSFAVQVGDVVALYMSSSASTGAMTRSVQGSVAGYYYNDAVDHTDFNQPDAYLYLLCAHNETITVASYTNTPSTITLNMSITRKI